VSARARSSGRDLTFALGFAHAQDRLSQMLWRSVSQTVQPS
jgi:acyl-homoserine lactone acylase PvdQ